MGANSLPENFLDLPDDELDNLNPDDMVAPTADPEPESFNESDREEEAPEAEENVSAADDAEETSEESSDEEQAGEAGAATEEEDDEEDSEASDADEEDAEETDTSAEEDDGEEVEDESDSDNNSDVDYEAFHKMITAPFKANGRTMQVTSPEDALQLMQMGVNYNGKMRGLKPNLKILKTLEKHDLLDEKKLGYLIDLSRKDPAAIQHLVKDSGLDPMEMDVEKESSYKPNTYTADEAEVELDMVLEELRDSETYDRTLEVVTNKWDGASRQTIAQNPQTLKVLNDHVASGVYDMITDEMERERTLGRLAGLSDIEAYRATGDAIAARNGFAHLQQPTAAQSAALKPKAKKPDTALKNKKRAASPTKKAAPAKPAEDFNPLALPDEEFEKLFNDKFLS